jgi:hypothetical protein
MSDLHSSTKAIINRDCLAEMCRQYQPTTPSGPTETGCPEPRRLLWDFGEVSGGMYTVSTKSFPSDASSALSATGAITADLASSDLPSGATFSLELATFRGTLSGTLPAFANTYHVLYSFRDRNKCEVATLTISISVGRGSTGQTPSPLAIAITNVLVEALCKESPTHLLTISYATSGGTPPVTVDSVSISLPNGMTQAIWDIAATTGQVPAAVTYSPGGMVTIVLQGHDAIGNTATSAPYATYLPPCSIGQTGQPGQTGSQEQAAVCVSVTAVVASAGTPIATLLRLQTYTDISVQIQIDGTYDPSATPFRLCRTPGTTARLVAPARVVTDQRLTLVFVRWEKYNSDTKAWEALPGVTGPELTILFQSGGSARAVYQQAQTQK